MFLGSSFELIRSDKRVSVESISELQYSSKGEEASGQIEASGGSKPDSVEQNMKI